MSYYYIKRKTHLEIKVRKNIETLTTFVHILILHLQGIIGLNYINSVGLKISQYLHSALDLVFYNY